MMEFVVLGVGADPRIYGYSPISSPEATKAAMQYVLTCPEQPSDADPMLVAVELLFEGGLEVLFGLAEFL